MTIKRIDKELEKLGFKKTYESDLFVRFERWNGVFEYMQFVDLLHKAHVPHCIQSYDSVTEHVDGLTTKEAKLFAKRIEKAWGKCK